MTPNNTTELIEALEQSLTDYFCDEGIGGAPAFIETMKAYGLTVQALSTQPAQEDVRERVTQIIMRSFSSMPSAPTWRDREKATYEMTDAILAALPQPTGSVSKLVERQHNDIGILISMIDGLAEATGEGPEEEDGVLFAQIKQSHNEAIAALSATPVEKWRPINAKAIEQLGEAGQRFFASITVKNKITDSTHVETPFLYLAECETEEGAIYYEPRVVGTDDETGWDIDDYEFYLPHDMPPPPALPDGGE